MNQHRPVLDGINLVVRDMDAAVAFYRRLGLEVPDAGPFNAHHRSMHADDGVDFDLDSVRFAQQWDEGWPGGTGCVIGFKVESREAVDHLYAELTGAGSRGQQLPYDAFWGARYAVVEDPDGNAVGLMSPIDPARRTMPSPPS